MSVSSAAEAPPDIVFVSVKGGPDGDLLEELAEDAARAGLRVARVPHPIPWDVLAKPRITADLSILTDPNPWVVAITAAALPWLTRKATKTRVWETFVSRDGKALRAVVGSADSEPAYRVLLSMEFPHDKVQMRLRYGDEDTREDTGRAIDLFAAETKRLSAGDEPQAFDIEKDVYGGVVDLHLGPGRDVLEPIDPYPGAPEQAREMLRKRSDARKQRIEPWVGTAPDAAPKPGDGGAPRP